MKEYRETSRANQEARLQAIRSGRTGTVAHPAGNIPAPGVRESGPQADDSIPVLGSKQQPRLDKPRRAAGGRVKKNAGTNVNIIVGAGHGQQASPPLPLMPMPNPAPGASPAPMMRPPMPVGAPGAGPSPMAGPIGPRRNGGRVFRRGGAVGHPDIAEDKALVRKMVKSGALKARGGGKFTAGADSGVGRLEKAEHARAK